MRRNAGPSESTPAWMSVKSVVPPPTSTTSTSRTPQRVGQIMTMMRGEIVKRGLRFFDERELLQPGLARGVHGQCARDFVERGRHGDHHFLRGQRGAGMRGVPGRREVGEQRAPRRPPAKPSAPPPARPTAESARSGPRPRGTASFSPRPPIAPARARPASARTRRRSAWATRPTATVSSLAAIHVRRKRKGTTATSGSAATSPGRCNCGIGEVNDRRVRTLRRVGQTRRRSSSCRGQCR